MAQALPTDTLSYLLGLGYRLDVACLLVREAERMLWEPANTRTWAEIVNYLAGV